MNQSGIIGPIAKSARREMQVERFCLVAAPVFFGASTFFWNLRLVAFRVSNG